MSRVAAITGGSGIASGKPFAVLLMHDEVPVAKLVTPLHCTRGTERKEKAMKWRKGRKGKEGSVRRGKKRHETEGHDTE